MTVKVKDMNVLIDEGDMGIFNSFNWHISDTGYVLWRGLIGGKKKTIRLHRLIARATDGDIVDHINRNKLDNRRANLRIVDIATNIRNSKRYDEAKGYYYDNSKRRWAIDSKRHGIKSLYMETEADCIEYLSAVGRGETPIRKINRRPSLGGRKLSDAQVERVFKEFEQGKTRRDIANGLGVSASTVGRIVAGKTTMGGKISKRGPSVKKEQ